MQNRPKRIKRQMYNKLTKREFNSLMKKASVELGINDNNLPVLDLYPEPPIVLPKTSSMLDIILTTLENKNVPGIQKALNRYEKIIQKRRFNNKDKIHILGWLLMPETTKKPMCLIDKKEKIKECRKIGLKTKGDISSFDRPFRMVFDDQFLKEISVAKNRTKFDAFDKLDAHTKIKWSGYAKKVMGENVNELFKKLKVNSGLFDSESFTVAMEYACKMCNIPKFKGIFAKPYWIHYRMSKFEQFLDMPLGDLGDKEFSVFFEIACKHLGINNKTIKIMKQGEAIKAVIPTLKNMKLYKEYQKWYDTGSAPKTQLQCLRKAWQLIFENK